MTTDVGFGARVLRVEVAEGLRAILREPTALFFSVLLPVGMFGLFVSLFGDLPGPSGLPTAATMLATYGSYGVVSVMLLTPGIRTAVDRESGWLRVKKVSGAPVGATIAAYVVAAVPYALAVLLGLGAVSFTIAGPVLGPVPAVRLLVVLLLGSLPFALFSLALGFVVSSNAAAAVLNAVLLPMVIASGLWFPSEMLPGFLAGIGSLLPAHHLARLALAQLTGADATGDVVALLVTTVLGGLLAGWAYRNLRL